MKLFIMIILCIGTLFLSVSENTSQVSANTVHPTENQKNETITKTCKKYEIYATLPIVLGTTGIYILSLILVWIKAVKYATHKKAWNYILLLNFLITGIIGVILSLRPLPKNMLVFHVQSASVLVVISCAHIIQRLKNLKFKFS